MKKERSLRFIIPIFLAVIIGLAVFTLFDYNNNYVLITGDTVLSPCTELGGQGCTNTINDGSATINDGGFCSGYSSQHEYCVKCIESYEWIKDSRYNDVIIGSCLEISGLG